MTNEICEICFVTFATQCVIFKYYIPHKILNNTKYLLKSHLADNIRKKKCLHNI